MHKIEQRLKLFIDYLELERQISKSNHEFLSSRNKIVDQKTKSEVLNSKNGTSFGSFRWEKRKDHQ